MNDFSSNGLLIYETRHQTIIYNISSLSAPPTLFLASLSLSKNSCCSTLLFFKSTKNSKNRNEAKLSPNKK